MEITEKKEINTLEDIRVLVDTFYGRLREDELIGPIFEERLKGKWELHLPKMYSFWQTILLGEHTYQGSPLLPHLDLPIEGDHFNRWIHIFHQTLHDLFTGEIAREAKWRAEKMAEMFAYKVDFYKNNSGAVQ